jgi:hypothetical protein
MPGINIIFSMIKDMTNFIKCVSNLILDAEDPFLRREKLGSAYINEVDIAL